MTDSSTGIIANQNKRREANRFISNESKSRTKGDSGQYQFQLNDVTSEFDSALMGREAAIKFTEMSKSDGIIGGAISSYNNLLASCRWTLDELVDPTPEELMVADVLKNWFFEKNNFENQLLAILKMLPLGFSCFNKYYTPLKIDNQVFMMPMLLERLQKSIWRIDYKQNFVEQTTSRGNLVEIPLKDLVFFTFRQEGIDLRGVSLLRQAYYDYKDKKEIKAIAKKGIVREMLGLPIAKVPKGTGIDSAEYEELAILMDTLSSRTAVDTDDAIILPNDYELEMFKADFKIGEVKDYLGYYDSSMLISVLAQFILLGQNGGGGSYSLGSNQSDFFTDGLKYIIDYISAQFTKEVITQTVKSNWENVDASKFKLVGLNLDKKASETFAGILKTLFDSGVIKFQESDEAQIREMYGLKPINNEEREDDDSNDNGDDAPPSPAGKKPNDGAKDSSSKDKSNKEQERKEENKSSLEATELPPIDLVNFYKTPKDRNSYIDQETTKLTKFSNASLQLISDKLLSSIRFQLKKGSTQAQGLKDVQLDKNMVARYKKQMGQRLSSIAQFSWDNAKTKSAPHLAALKAQNPSDLPDKTLTSFILNQSDLSVEKQVENLRDSSLLVANTATTKGYGLDQTLAQVEKNMDEFIASGNNAELASMVSIPQAMTYAEQAYYKSIDDSLWGYRYENVSPKTNICKSLVGKTYRVGSIEMENISPPNHFRCKSYFEPIYKDEEKPEMDNYIPAPSVMREKTM